MNVTESTGLSSEGIDALKGILIVLIAAGHNPLITIPFPGLFEVIYSFHVMGFLLLPFWFAVPPLSARLVRDRAVRYLAPHYAFYLFGCVLFAFLLARDPWWQRLAAIASGALVASADLVKAGSGLSLFWFLPALLTLTLLRSAMHTRARAAVVALALAGHLGAGALPEIVQVWTPFGLLIALFAFPLGQLVAGLWPRYVAPWVRAWGVVFGIGWAAGLWYIYTTRSVFNIGEMAVPSLRTPLKLLFHDLNALLGFGALAALCATPVGRWNVLAKLGEASLIIFLVHSFVQQVLLRLAGAAALPRTFGTGLVLLALTVALSYGVARGLMNNRLFVQWVTPRSAADWPPLRRVAQRLPEG